MTPLEAFYFVVGMVFLVPAVLFFTLFFIACLGSAVLCLFGMMPRRWMMWLFGTRRTSVRIIGKSIKYALWD